MDELQKEIEALRAANRILEEENTQLSVRAEDAMLLGLVAEAIEGFTEPQAIIELVLERCSILKDLPFVSCGRLRNHEVLEISSYASFSESTSTGYPIRFNEEILSELHLGPYLLESLENVTVTFASQNFVPQSLLLIPFQCHHYGTGVFLFFDRPNITSKLSEVVFLLDQMVRMTCSRLDNIYLGRQLELFNSELEERVLLKTLDLRESNARLQQTYDRFVAVLNGVDAYIYVTDSKEYIILFANKMAKRLFGENMEGQKCHQVLRQEDRPCDFCEIPELLAAGNEDERVIRWESVNPGTDKWFLNSERIIDWPESPKALLTIGTDISAVKKAEEEQQLLAKKLHQAQKMEAIGVLAGSIAHDLNNILSGVVSYPDLLLAKMDLDPVMIKALETIRTAGNKGVKIVQGLLTLSRRGIQVEEPVFLDRLLKEYFESPEWYELQRRYPQVKIAIPETWQSLVVKGSRVHLSNVLMNLVTNAAEAMPEGGTITISLSMVTPIRQPPGFLAWQPGPYAKISVSDTGTGIPAEHLGRIFEPFFSLKNDGPSGTGLGLAIAWGTVADHRGYIEVDSTEGRGTTFRVFLPVVSTETFSEKHGEEIQVVNGQGQNILVVDDDQQQRQLASEILTHLGYRVEVAESGESAILILKKKPVDLVILDMLMPPGIDGLETYQRIRHFRPDQKTIIVSGFSQSERVRKALSLGVCGYLQKPYSLAKIGKIIYEVLSN